MTTFILEPAQQEDNKAICELCSIPLPGNIVLALERAPDYFAGAAVQCTEVEVYVCRNTGDGKIYGLFSIGKREVFVNGKKKSVRYFCDLRIHPDFQKSSLLYQICRFPFENKILENEFAQTVIFTDNNIMLELIKKLSGRAEKLSIPMYLLAGDYITYTLLLSKKITRTKSHLNIRWATSNDIDRMQDFFDEEAPKKQFYPYYDFSELTTGYYNDITIGNYMLAYEGDKLVGITGIWDQKRMKQTKIVSYSKTYAFMRPAVNFISFFTGGFPLPRPGTILNHFFLHTILVKDNAPAIFKVLVEYIHCHYHKSSYQYILCGLNKNDSLNNVFSKVKAKRITYGKHYLVSFDNDLMSKFSQIPFYFEAARI